MELLDAIFGALMSVRRLRPTVPRLTSFVFAFVLMLFLALAGSALWNNNRASEAVAPPHAIALEIDSKSLELGDIWLQDAKAVRLVVRNTSSQPITVQEWTASCICTSIKPRSMRIAAHSSEVLNVVLDLRPFARDRSDLLRVEITADLLATGGRRKLWTINGHVRSPLEISPPFVHYKRGELIHGSPFPQVAVHLAPRTGVVSIVPKFDPDFVKALVKRNSSGDGSFELLVTPSSSLGIGRHEAKILLHCDTEDNLPLLAVPIKVMMPVVTDVGPDQGTLVFVQKGTDRPQPKLLSFTSFSNDSFCIEPTGSPIRLTIVPCANKNEIWDGHAFAVSVDSVAPGVHNVELTFQVSHQRKRRYEIRVPAVLANMPTKK